MNSLTLKKMLYVKTFTRGLVKVCRGWAMQGLGENMYRIKGMDGFREGVNNAVLPPKPQTLYLNVMKRLTCNDFCIFFIFQNAMLG